MKNKLFEHLLSILSISIILLLLLFVFNLNNRTSRQNKDNEIRNIANMEFFNVNNQFDKALLKDAMNIYYPGEHDKNSELIKKLIISKEDEIKHKLQKSYLEEKLSWNKFIQILFMYFKFLLVYAIVMALAYYGVQTLGVWRFCRKKRGFIREYSSYKQKLQHYAKKIFLGIASFILFSPAYVIAYSMRTEINTDTMLFVIILCVISNGLLMVYSNKFYAFLISENRKGYVDTALVKNLNNSYLPHVSNGISYKSILRPFKQFNGHVFDHIFKNAQYQYLSTLKEQASFIITGLIITEMALNIHGHLSYEMLRQMLYKNYDIVIVIILGIFYAVKITEIFTDYILYKMSLKYENKNQQGIR